MTHPPRRIDRKQFLKWTLSSSSALALGCSPTPDGSVRGPGGTSGSGGSAAGSGGGTSPSAGTGGSTAGGSGGGGVGGGGTPGGGGGTSGGGSGGTVPVTPDCNAHIGVFITADHGHVLAVTLADITAAVDKVYDTTGTSDPPHPHWVQLTAADFAKLSAGGTVRKLTCNDGHEHEYIVNCTGVMPTTTPSAVAFCDPLHSCADTNTNFCPELPDMP